MIDFSADDVLAMNADDLRELRAEVAKAQPEGGLPTDAYLEFMRLTNSLGSPREFEEMGGRAALERTIERLNALDFED